MPSKLWTQSRLVILLLAPTLLFPLAYLAAQQLNNMTLHWPQGRGNPLQTGVAPSALPDKLEILWKFKADDSFEDAACIVNNTVYAGNYDEHLYAVNLETGKQQWKYNAGPIKAAPAFYKGFIYVGDENGVLHCVDATNGKKRWTFETKGEITCCPNFYKDRVIFGSHDSTLYCLSLEGKKLWELRTEGPVNGSPVVVGNKTFVAGCDSVLHMIDIDTGKETGSVDLEGQAAATAAVQGDFLYVGTMTNQVVGINWKESKVVWRFEPKKKAQPFYSSAAVTDTLVVVGSRDRKVYALNRKDGTKSWEFLTGGRVDPSPVIAGKRVYAPSLDGKLYVLDLQTGNKLDELQLGKAIASSPAVSGNRLVIGTVDGVLYCLGNKGN